MSEILPTLYIARPGDTPWSLSGQHTRLTDLTLTERGQSNGRRLSNQLREWAFTHVFTSPLRNYVVWRYSAVIAGLGLLFSGIALMRFLQMLVHIQA
jgi:bisphosphoglycerate-dependent phosphoglycerate mutase